MIRRAISIALFALGSAAIADEQGSVQKFTAVDLTGKFRDDKTDKMFLQYAGKQVEVEGEVAQSQKFASGEGWSIKLKGCNTPKTGDAWVIMSFEANNPDLAKAKKLVEGDKVTVRAEFLINYGASVGLKEPRIVAGGKAAGAAEKTSEQKPDVTAAAEQFVKDAVADPKAAEGKLKGKVVELSGTVSTANPTYSIWGFTLAAGKRNPADSASGLWVECAVPEDQLEKAWLLATGQKVKVVGTVTGIEKDRVRLAKCVVTELEPNPMPKVKAAEIAAAYEKNEKDASKKYGDRYNMKEVLLEGVVNATKEGEYGTIVTLDGTAKTAVRVQVDKKEGAALKAGDAIKLKASCRGLWADQMAVLFQGRVLKDVNEKK